MKDILVVQTDDILETHADTARLRVLSGCEPRVLVEDEVKRFVAWCRVFFGKREALG